jgi:hypothetical protein
VFNPWRAAQAARGGGRQGVGGGDLSGCGGDGGGFEEFAFVEVDEAGGGGRAVGVVGDHEDGFVELAIQALKKFEDVFGALGVEVAGRFVGEDEVGVGDDGAGDGDALFLAAGELAGEVVHAVFEANEFEGGGGVFFALLAGEGGELEGEFDVFEGGENGDEVEGLEDEAEVVISPAGEFAFGHGGGLVVEDGEGAVGGAVHAGDEVEEGGFAGAGGAHEGAELAAVDGEFDFVEGEDGGLAAAEFLGEVRGLDNDFGHEACLGLRVGDTHQFNTKGARSTS